MYWRRERQAIPQYIPWRVCWRLTAPLPCKTGHCCARFFKPFSASYAVYFARINPANLSPARLFLPPVWQYPVSVFYVQRKKKAPPGLALQQVLLGGEGLQGIAHLGKSGGEDCQLGGRQAVVEGVGGGGDEQCQLSRVHRHLLQTMI